MVKNVGQICLELLQRKTSEEQYWTNCFSTKYGSSLAATHVLESFEEFADVLLAMQRLF